MFALVHLDDARADALDAHQRLGRREVAVRLAIRDDRLGERRADPRELARELRGIRRVDVDGPRGRGESAARERERAPDSKDRRFHGHDSYGEKERPC